MLFKPLKLAEIEQIVDLSMEGLRRRLADRRIALELTEPARRLIGRNGYDPVYGARPLRRYIQRIVETQIGRTLLGGQILDGATITLGTDGEGLVVTWSNPLPGVPDGASPMATVSHPAPGRRSRRSRSARARRTSSLAASGQP